MQTENLKSFFVWYVITCHLTTYRASRNRFSAISFHDYLHYCGIFLARFFIKIDLNIISSLHVVYFGRELVGVMSNEIKRNMGRHAQNIADVNKMWLLIIQLAQYSTALQVVRIIIFLSGMCLFCRKNCGPRPKLYLRLNIFSMLVNYILFTYLRKSFIPDNQTKKHANDGMWIRPWQNTNDFTS